MEALLKVEDLKKYFPVRMGFLAPKNRYLQAVDGISFSIQPGETLGLVGESGSGKTTTGRCVLGLTPLTAGRVWFKGQDIGTKHPGDLRPIRKHMQIIFQDPYSSLNPRFTVGRIIGDTLRHLSTRQRKDAVLETMQKVGLRPEHYERYPHEFSGGQRQRIAIARAIAPKPDLVVADEPLSALDVSIQAQVVNLLERLKEEFGLSYLFISHDLNVVEHISDRIAVMYLGKIVELASGKQFYAEPKHPYAMALVSAVPLPQVREGRKRIILRGDIPTPLNPPKGCRFHPRCFRVMDICSEVEPPLKDVGGAHYAACHLY